MPNYRCAALEGGTYFFTVDSYKLQRFLCDPDERSALRNGITETRRNYPFNIDAWVSLSGHLHCIWILPPDDGDYRKRWASIKRFVSKQCGKFLYRDELMTASKRKRNESTVWQRRYWEHMIRDQDDLNRHRDYIHWKPVKQVM